MDRKMVRFFRSRPRVEIIYLNFAGVCLQKRVYMRLLSAGSITRLGHSSVILIGPSQTCDCLSRSKVQEKEARESEVVS